MSRIGTPRCLSIAALLVLLLGVVLPAQAAPVRLDPRLVEYLANAPGGQGSFLVLLKDQADLAGAPLVAGRTARVAYVYKALRDTAERSQAGLRADLAAWGVAYHPFYIMNAIQVTGDLALARRLAGRPEVARLVPDPAFNGIDDPPAGPAGPPAVDAVEWNVARVHAPEVWALGYTGQGIVVGSVDTGVQYNHPALVNQYRGNLGGGNFDHNYNWTEPFSLSTVPYDSGSHGTHTTGTMVGDDGGTNQVGVAPGAQWIACKVDSNGEWHASKYIACWEWMLAPTDLNGQNPNPALAAHVVNNSWSCPESEGCDADTLLPAAQALYAAGIAIAKSGGNAGSGCGTITNPGQYSELLATGAFNSSDAIASFSSRGPSVYQSETRVKPDIAAPGVGIRSSVPGNGYGSSSGTSMASPHTAGVIALLWSARPALQGDLEETYQVIKATAEPKINAQCPPYVDHPNDVWGWGIIDALAAAQSGELRGTVYDNVMAPLPGTAVEVAPVGGGLVRQTTADANAVYSFTLPAGAYLITATLPGYLPSTGTVTVEVGLTTTHDIVLEPIPPCEPVQGADFDWTPLAPAVGEVVTFGAWASGTLPITYSWMLEDGTWSEGQVVTHSYGLPGTYVVVLTATNCATATATATHTVTVAGVPRIVPPPAIPSVALEPDQQAFYSFTVANTGTADLVWSLAEVPDAPWLEESPVDGIIGPGAFAEVLLTYTAPITTGVYTTNVRISSNDPLNPEVDLLVELDVVELCAPITHTGFTWTPTTPSLGSPVSFAATAWGDWQIEQVDRDWCGDANSLALDAAGLPHISYADEMVYGLRYAHYNGTTWITETVDSGNLYGTTSLAVGAGDRPHITYRMEGALRYASYDGTAWITQTVDIGNTGWYPSLALDGAGLPHIAYIDVPVMNTTLLKYAFHDGSVWHIETVDSPYASGRPSLALDSAGLPRISYQDRWDGTLNYATYNGSTWQHEIVEPARPDYTSLALDGSDRPHIGYNTADDELRYATFGGTDWSTATVDTGVIEGVSLALDAAGRPRIAYFGDGIYRTLFYASYDGSAWQRYAVDDFGGAQAIASVWGVSALALDAAGRPHIAYYHAALGEIYLHYARLAQTLPTPPITYTWDFGDGNADSGEEVVHAFAAAGTYTVTVTAENGCGQATAASVVTVVHRIYLPLVSRH